MGRLVKLKIEKVCEYCHKNYVSENHRVGPKVIARRRFCSKSCSAFSRKEIYRENCRRIGKLSKSEKTRKIISEFMKKQPINNKAIEAMRKSNIGGNGRYLGFKHSSNEKIKISNASKKHWERPTYRKAVLGRRPMSSLETKVQSVIDKYKLPYKFVGNGKFSIERKVPDFINTNRQKIAIEVFARRHKELFKENGLEGWKKEREKIFSKYGWDTIFIEDWQTNKEETIFNLLRGGDYNFRFTSEI